MDLRTALALLGLLVIGAVAINVFDRGRIRRRLRALWSAREPARPVRPSAARSPAVCDVPLPAPERKVLRPIPTRGAEAAVEAAADAETPVVNEPFGSIDFIVFLPGDTPAVRDAALSVYKQNEYVIDKPHRLYGQQFNTKKWSNLARDPATTEYGLLALALQLVDQSGAVTESELNAVAQVALKMADALDRPPRFNMTFEEAVEKAASLDRFCADHDVIATINVVADSAVFFRGPAIERAAVDAGLNFGARNIFHRDRERGGAPPLFSLANLYQPGSFDPLRWETLRTQGLTLFMPVPCVEDPAAVFADMTTVAQLMARKLGGRLTDQDQRPLSAAGIETISHQIRDIAVRMHEHGVDPGSIAALRLFPS